MSRAALILFFMAWHAAALAIWNSDSLTIAIGELLGETDKPAPPAGQQFDEGPVLVRMPGASIGTVRFIF